MVGTGPPPSLDNILARVSLVNYHGEQIYDTYVLPRAGENVTDYRTHVSGIRPQHLQPGTARSFEEAQSTVAALLKGNILVGHALGNDLDALMLGHPKRDIRDTARHAKYRKMAMGRAPGLRKLSKMVLGLEIQTGEHSSVEDARAAMELFKHERAGFEEEVRRRYGGSGGRKSTRERVKGEPREKSAVAAREESVDVESEGDDEEEDDGDEEGQAQKVDADTAAKKPKKKRKAKKRTRRA